MSRTLYISTWGGYSEFSSGGCAQVRNRWRTTLFLLGQQALVAASHGRRTLPVRGLAHLGAKFGHRPIHLHIVLNSWHVKTTLARLEKNCARYWGFPSSGSPNGNLCRRRVAVWSSLSLAFRRSPHKTALDKVAELPSQSQRHGVGTETILGGYSRNLVLLP